MTSLMNAIVLVLAILVYGFEGIPNLLVVVARLVTTISPRKLGETRHMYVLTFNVPNNKKYLPH